MAEREKKIEGYKWVTNVNPSAEYAQDGGLFVESRLLTPRSNGEILREHAAKFKVPIRDVMITNSQAFSGMKAVYVRKKDSKTK